MPYIISISHCISFPCEIINPIILVTITKFDVPLRQLHIDLFGVGFIFFVNPIKNTFGNMFGLIIIKFNIPLCQLGIDGFGVFFILFVNLIENTSFDRMTTNSMLGLLCI